jgi:hypothetical protein
VVKLPEEKAAKIPEKPTINVPLSETKPIKSTNKEEGKTMSPNESVNELLMLINTLGDITVRAVKNKDKLTNINWRLPTYFIYERFHFEREKIADNLKNHQIVYRKHRKIDKN